MNADLYMNVIRFDVENIIDDLRDRMNGYCNNRTAMCQTSIGRALSIVAREWLNDPKRHQGDYNYHLVYYAIRALLEYGFQPVTNEQVEEMNFGSLENLFINCNVNVEWGNEATYKLAYYKIRAIANKLGKQCYLILSADPSWQGVCPMMRGLLPVDI